MPAYEDYIGNVMTGSAACAFDEVGAASWSVNNIHGGDLYAEGKALYRIRVG